MRQDIRRRIYNIIYNIYTLIYIVTWMALGYNIVGLFTCRCKIHIYMSIIIGIIYVILYIYDKTIKKFMRRIL